MPCAVGRLKRRPDYLRVAATRRRWATPGLILQAAPADRRAATAPSIRVGITASRKVGGAVDRNRARRRLRALVARVFPDDALPDMDYVVIARRATVNRPFADLVSDLEEALRRIAGQGRRAANS